MSEGTDNKAAAGGPLCLRDIIKVSPITFELIREGALRAFLKRASVPKSIKKVSPEKAKAFKYLLKAENVYKFLAMELSPIARLPSLSELHPFHREIALIATGGLYEELRKEARLVVRVLSDLWRHYRNLILKSDPLSAKSSAGSFVGRALSLVRRKAKHIDLTKSLAQAINETPCVDLSSPIILVSGMPQVGKSTLVRRVSSAKPEVAPYPFTTKRIIIGHLMLGHLRVQIIDTPGLLDRPVEEMNPIERRAVAALRNLRAVALFLLDPSPNSYYNFEQQVTVLKTVEELVGKDKIIVVINKIDLVSEERIKEVESAVRNLGFEPLKISALLGIGIAELLHEAMKKYDELFHANYSSLFARENIRLNPVE